MKLPAHIRALQEQVELYKRLRPAWLDMYEQIGKTWAPLRQHLKLMERIKLDSAAFRLQELTESHQRLVDIAQKARENFQWVKDIRNTHRTWLESIRPVQDSLAHFRSAIEPLAGVSQYLTASQKLFAGIDFSAIRQSYALPDSFVIQSQSALANLTQGYTKLTNSIKSLPDLVELPTYTLPGASREIFTTGYAFNRICTDDIEADEKETALVKVAEQESSMCLALLREINPALEKPYLGARDAFMSDSPDKARHIYASLREMWNHLLRELAPDEKVLSWLPKDKKGYLT